MVSAKWDSLCKKCTLKKKKMLGLQSKGMRKTKYSSSKIWWKNRRFRKESLQKLRSTSKLLNLVNNKKLKAASSKDTKYIPRCSLGPGSQTMEQNGELLEKRVSTGVTSYLHPRLNRVSSFIVESAFRFSKEPDFTPGTKDSGYYKIDGRMDNFDEKRRTKKIRFRIPKGTLGYEDAKKAMWRSKKGQISSELKSVPTRYPNRCKKSVSSSRMRSFESKPDSIQELMPVLEWLKRGDEVVDSELDLSKISRYLKKNRLNKEKKETKKRKGKVVVEDGRRRRKGRTKERTAFKALPKPTRNG